MAKKKAAKKAAKKPAKKAATKTAKPSAKKAAKKAARRGPSKNVISGIRRLRGPADTRKLTRGERKRALALRKPTGFFDSKGKRIKQGQARAHQQGGKNLYIRSKGDRWGMIEGAGG